MKELNLTGKRILLAEDIELNAEVAEAILSEEVFLVEAMENGKVALEMVKNSEVGYYDFVLMDMLRGIYSKAAYQ